MKQTPINIGDTLNKLLDDCHAKFNNKLRAAGLAAEVAGRISIIVMANCPKCHGTGYIYDQKINGDNAIITMRFCNCVRFKEREKDDE